MLRLRTCAIFSALVGFTSSAAGMPPELGVYPEEPPKEIKELIDRLKRGEVQAIKLLGARDEAAPYLRRELIAATDKNRQRDLAEALAPIEARIYQRNKKRFEKWVEEGRFDLCTELIVDCPEKKDAPELADLTFPLRQQIAKQFIKTVDPFGPEYKGHRELFWFPVFKSQEHEHHAGAELTIRDTDPTPTLIRADRCVAQGDLQVCWFAAVRSELRTAKPKLPITLGAEWLSSIVLVNNTTELPQATKSLIICDGDVEITSDVDRSVVIANGNILKKGGFNSRSFYAAAGDISIPVPSGRTPGKCVYHAGGTVTPAKRPGTADVVREKQSALPFGVRFLDPSEFGLALTAQKDGIKLSQITKDSRFAKYGVEAGDIVASIDDVKCSSIADFRRQLRRGILAESVVLRIRRDGREITRIVFLDGIPLPVAPMPREVK